MSFLKNIVSSSSGSMDCLTLKMKTVLHKTGNYFTDTVTFQKLWIFDNTAVDTSVLAVNRNYKYSITELQPNASHQRK